MGVSSVQAQPSFDATDLMKEQARQESRQEMRQDARESVSGAVEKKTTNDKQKAEEKAASFLLKTIHFTKTTQLTREELVGVITPWLEKNVTLADIYKIVDLVTNLYREKGIYTSLALLPQQTIKNGTVVIQLVEGELGDVVIKDNQWTSEDWVKRWVQKDAEETLNKLDMKVLESNILLFNRLNDQNLQAQLMAGKTFGKTDILVSVSEPERNNLKIWLDNYGNKSTGQASAGLMLQHNKWLFDSDRFVLYGTRSKSSESLVFDYSTGLGQSPMRVGISLSKSDSEITEGAFADADVDSKAGQQSFYINYLAWSAANAWLEIRASTNNVRSHTTIAGVVLTDTFLQRYSLTPSLTWQGQNWRLYTNISINKAHFKDKIVPENSQSVRYAYATVNGLWRLTPTQYVLGNLEQQMDGERGMPSSLAFSTGGATSIRGYKPGIESGDKGWFYQSEWHYDGIRWQDFIWDTFVFYDRGRYESVTENKILDAIGGGLSLYGNNGMSFDLTVAKNMNGDSEAHGSWLPYGRFSYTW